MKILTRKDLGNYNLARGDTLVLLIDDKEVARVEAEEPTSIDTAIIAELNKKESAVLGLESGIAGIFGKRAR
jgi:hypothetical protein